MSKFIIFIIIVITIILLVAVKQEGFEGIKQNPADSAVQSTKTIYNFGKDSVGKGSEIYQIFKKEKINGTLVEVCKEDKDCQKLQECSLETDICFCIAQNCYKSS